MTGHRGESQDTGRWYGDRDFRAQPQARVQIDHDLRTIPEGIARLAHDEYRRHHDQDFDRLQERGGFSLGEVVMLLADRCDRLSLDLIEARNPGIDRDEVRRLRGPESGRHLDGES